MYATVPIMHSLGAIGMCALVCIFYGRMVESCSSYQLRKFPRNSRGLSLSCISPNHSCQAFVKEAEECSEIPSCYGVVKYDDGVCSHCAAATEADPIFTVPSTSDLYLVRGTSELEGKASARAFYSENGMRDLIKICTIMPQV